MLGRVFGVCILLIVLCSLAEPYFEHLYYFGFPHPTSTPPPCKPSEVKVIVGFVGSFVISIGFIILLTRLSDSPTNDDEPEETA